MAKDDNNFGPENGSWNSREPVSPDILLPKLIAEKLKKEEGLFFGEDHTKHAIVQSVTRLLRPLQNEGVTTISLEYSQEQVDAIKDYIKHGKKTAFTENFANKRPDVIALIAQADKLGIKVLGHELPECVDAIAKADALPPVEREEALRKLADYWTSSEGLQKRDNYAAAYIEKHRGRGKVIVIGGELHASNVTGYLENSPPNPNRAEERLPNGAHRALSEKLGIPSITGVYTVPDGEIGNSYQAPGPKANFHVYLPKDLKDYMQKQFPPEAVKPMNNGEMGMLTPEAVGKAIAAITKLFR